MMAIHGTPARVAEDPINGSIMRHNDTIHDRRISQMAKVNVVLGASDQEQQAVSRINSHSGTVKKKEGNQGLDAVENCATMVGCLIDVQALSKHVSRYPT